MALLTERVGCDAAQQLEILFGFSYFKPLFRLVRHDMSSPVFPPSLQVPPTTILPTENEDGVCSGELDGVFMVTPDGGAHYSLPLWVPPGRNGMEPRLSLEYD